MEKELRESKDARAAEVGTSRTEPRELNKTAKAEFLSPRSDPEYSPNPMSVYTDVFGTNAAPPLVSHLSVG